MGKIILSLILSFFTNLGYAFRSASVWCFVWVVAFFGSTAVVDLTNGNDGVQVSALALTFAVFAGHFTKLISYMTGSDTDFRHIFLRNDSRNNGKPLIFRLIVSALFMATAATFILAFSEAANVPKEILSIDFVANSLIFWCVILPLFLTQMVFSWPDPKQATI